MSDTRFANSDLPPETLDFFALRGDVVHWIDAPPWQRSANFRKRRVPFGEPAGGRIVFGRGKLVTFARCALLTTDIAFALQHGGEWPWQIGAGAQHDCDTTDTTDAATWRALIRERFALAGDCVTWRVDRGYNPANGSPQYPAGSPVTGFPLSGYRGRMFTTGGMGFLAGDVASVLKNNAFPFEWD